MNFGNNLEKILKEKKISKIELSRKLGLDRSVITRWCKGINVPSLIYVEKISNILNVTTDELIK